MLITMASGKLCASLRTRIFVKNFSSCSSSCAGNFCWMLVLALQITHTVMKVIGTRTRIMNDQFLPE